MGFVPVFGTLLGLIAYIYDLGETLFVGTLNLVISRLDAIDTSLFSNASFAAVYGIGYANAVFPLQEFVTMWIAIGVGCLSVVVIRWIKSFVPTVAN